MEFATSAAIVLDATTNLLQANTFTISPPILGALWQDGTAAGWPNNCNGTCPWPLTIPINTHLYGLSAANYLTSSTLPYNATTFIPPAGSAAIAAGTELSGNPLSSMPVRWQYNVATAALTPRIDPLTLGAADSSTSTVSVAATPTFSPGSGTYSTAQTVTISSTTPSATIYYTTNGSIPTTGSQQYSGPITVSSSETISAIAAASGYTNSAPGSASYVINMGQVATPTFSPGGGTYTSIQNVTITDTTAGAKIYYTTNGSTPTTSSAVYSTPIAISTTEPLKAIAVLTGYTNSNVASAVYTINLTQAASPTFSPGAGTYTSAQTVTISSKTPSATIYYTTNGTAPTTSSTVYSGPIAVSTSETVQAIATATGYANSSVASAAYTINLIAADFSVSASPTSITVTSGLSGTTTISIVPVGGFNSQVSFGCSGLPAGATCAFSPSTVTPSSGPASTTLSISTASLFSEAARPKKPGPLLPGSVLAAALGLFGWKKRRRVLLMLLLVVSAVGVLTLNGCGGGTLISGSSQSTVTVTATSGSLQHTTTISLATK
jgi:hypothetical protein